MTGEPLPDYLIVTRDDLRDLLQQGHYLGHAPDAATGLELWIKLAEKQPEDVTIVAGTQGSAALNTSAAMTLAMMGMVESWEPIRSATNAYRLSMVEAGFPQPEAVAMAAQFHAYLVDQMRVAVFGRPG